MNTASPFTAMLPCDFETGNRSVIDIVDDLLRLCTDRGLHADWHVDHCRMRSLIDESEAGFVWPLRKSAFRAVLARLAALCIERSPERVSPYGGQAVVSVSSDPRPFEVSFVNTPDEQWFTFRPLVTIDDRDQLLLPRIAELEQQAAEQTTAIAKLQEQVFQLASKLEDRVVDYESELRKNYYDSFVN